MPGSASLVTFAPRLGECRWEQLLEGVWSVVRRHTGAGRIEYLAIRNPSAAARRLTAFERRLIRLAITGEYNTQIAKELGVHESTVSRVLSRALRKLGLSTRADLMLLHAALAPPDPEGAARPTVPGS